MFAQWIGDIVGKMHIFHITNEDIAKKMNVSDTYISLILNEKRTPPNAEQRLNQALDELIAQQQNKKAPR